MSLSTTPSLDSSARPSFASGYASPLTGGMAHPELWDGVIGAWSPALGPTGGALRDLSGWGNHATIQGATPAEAWAVPGSITLDGSADYFSAPARKSETAPLSFAVWFKIPAANIGNQYALVSIADSATQQDYLVLYANGTASQTIQMQSRDGGTSTASTSSGYSADTWHLASGSFDSITSVRYARAYLDGGSEGSFAVIRTPTSLDAVGIGVLARLSKFGYMGGEIADVLIWDRTVSQREFEKLYRLGPAGIYERKIYVPYTQPTVQPAGSVGTFITSEVKPSYASGYASPLTGGMAHPELWEGVVGAWCPSLGATGGVVKDVSGRVGDMDLTQVTTSNRFVIDRDGPCIYAANGTNEYAKTTFDPAGLTAWSVNAWVKFENDAAVSYVWGCFDGDFSGRFYLRRESDQSTMRIGCGGSTFTYASAAENDVWTCYSVTYDGAGVTLYRDGVAVGTDAISGQTFTTEPMWVAAANKGGTADGVGKMKFNTVTVRNRPLTANEVAKLYRLGPAGIYQRKQPVITTAEEVVVGGLSIPIAAYHYNHNVGSRL